MLYVSGAAYGSRQVGEKDRERESSTDGCALVLEIRVCHCGRVATEQFYKAEVHVGVGI